MRHFYLWSNYRHYRIFERDRREFTTEFVGRVIAEEKGDALLQERGGTLHYVNQFPVEESGDGPLIYDIRCESWSCGTDYDDLVRNAMDWMVEGIGFMPSLLTPGRKL